MRKLSFDLNKCTECHSCELMCSYIKHKVYNTSKALLRLKSNFPDSPKLQFCRQCSKPLCMASCGFNAIYIKNEVIEIDKNKCTGCGECAKACPFNSIFVNDCKAVKCDTCNGQFKCAGACMTKALAVRE